MNKNSITQPSDWDEFFANRDLDSFMYKHYITNVMDKYVWYNGPGKIFELGSGASRLLARSAVKRWEISGIDFHIGANNILRESAIINDFAVGTIIDADVTDFDCSNLSKQFDVLISSTFFCHFNDPAEILYKWKKILKPGGTVLTVMPNLESINGKLMKRYNIHEWNKHKVYNPQQIDKFHLDAGLTIVQKAYYTGGYDIDFYVPWVEIKKKINSSILFKFLRYVASFVVKPICPLLPFNNSKFFNRHIIGIYKYNY